MDNFVFSIVFFDIFYFINKMYIINNIRKDDYLVGYGMELENIDIVGWIFKFVGVRIVFGVDIGEDFVVDYDFGVG